MKMHTGALPGARGAVANAILCSRNCDLPRVADPCKSYWINGASLSLKSTFNEFSLGGKAMKVTMTAVVPFQTKKESGIYVPRERHQQVLHSTTPERLEVVKSLETWAQETLLPFIRPVEKCWQPQDYLPHPSSDGFYDELRELRARAADLPDDYLVVLVGSMITEDALPTYQTMLNSLDGTRDETGASNTPWAIWTRAWTSEEKRHGDLLSKYLYLNGRVNMRSIEKTVQYLIGSGMDPKTENNPYLCFVYTSFQERATFISHGNIARRAKLCGDRKLASLCGIIAADEKRHEHAYCKIVEKLFEVDPDGAMVAFGDMMSKNIVMPAHLMYDGQDQNLYSKYSVVSHRTGTYTTADYISILEHLLKRWNVEKIEGLSSEGRKAQSFLCTLPCRLKKLELRSELNAKRRFTQSATGPFSWISGRVLEY